MCVNQLFMLSAGLLVDHKLLVVKVLGSQKLHTQISECTAGRGYVTAPDSCVKGQLYFVSFIFMERYNLLFSVFYSLSQVTVTGETYPTLRPRSRENTI